MFQWDYLPISFGKCFFLFQKHSILSDYILKYKNNCATKLTLRTGFLTSQYNLITIVLIENQKQVYENVPVVWY